ncbi:MAG: PfkB family carbohydrate kinase [Bacteroidales bacterium]|jgi:sugar/nucleoside kinase (ribokinase family)|nr:PfkB family carbohydrate kinase [Bacteroidales bacterium]
MTNHPQLLLSGPVTKDTIINSGATYHHIGGAVYYQSTALAHLGARVTAIVTISPKDKSLLDCFHPDVKVIPVWTEHTMEFLNNYPDKNNPNTRIQQAYIHDNPILPAHLDGINIPSFDAVYILPLCPYDIPLCTIRWLAAFQKPLFLGAQGYLRHLTNGKVTLKRWVDFREFAACFTMLFSDDNEARYIVAGAADDLNTAAHEMIACGIDEIVITKGDRGSIIVTRSEEANIPAFPPATIADPTGLGDTYMAVYTLQRMRGCSPQQSGESAAIAASMKIGYQGAFNGNFEQITNYLISK